MYKRQVDSLDRYWAIFPQLKHKLFSVLRDGFYQLNVAKDDIRRIIHDDEEFSAYADKLDNAFTQWRESVDGELDVYKRQEHLLVICRRQS